MTTLIQHGWRWPWLRPRQHMHERAAGASVVSWPSPDNATVIRLARDRRLATLLTEGELAWLLDERFDAPDEIWTIDLLRADAEHGWRRQRYKYDAATDVLYFWGERPLDVVEVRAMNLRTLPRFAPQIAPSPAAQPTPAATAGAASPAPQPAWGALRPQLGGAA